MRRVCRWHKNLGTIEGHSETYEMSKIHPHAGRMMSVSDALENLNTMEPTSFFKQPRMPRPHRLPRADHQTFAVSSVPSSTMMVPPACAPLMRFGDASGFSCSSSEISGLLAYPVQHQQHHVARAWCVCTSTQRFDQTVFRKLESAPSSTHSARQRPICLTGSVPRLLN